MGLRWTDSIDIAIELYEAHPDVIDNGFVSRFTRVGLRFT